MGRPEPCVLFAQTILHSQLDEYVDEVTFSQPVVITACEILEQNASPSTPNISLVGATSPPSFALEVFVHCEGESRFRRLCQPFLYSHSSSNVLEVETIITNHVVLRGTYRSLTLVIYGNTAEALGQFDIDVDMDLTLAINASSSADGKTEDLPPVLLSSKLSFEESLCSLKFFRFQPVELDLLPEVRQFCLLILQVYQNADKVNVISNIVGLVISAVSQYAMVATGGTLNALNGHIECSSFRSDIDCQKVQTLCDARDEILQIWKDLSSESNLAIQLEMLPSTEVLVNNCLSQFSLFGNSLELGFMFSYKDNNVVLPLCMILLLSSSVESCLYVIKSGVMEHIKKMICCNPPNSSAITLLVLRIIEHSTRHIYGCEAFLGWLSREDGIVPDQSSKGYSSLVKILLEKERHDIASLATYILQRLRLYEIISRYETTVISLLENLPVDKPFTADDYVMLYTTSTLLLQFLKLIDLCEPIEDPSVSVAARKHCNSEHSEGLLSYKATLNFLALSKYKFSRADLDSYMLYILKEKNFLALSAALLSSPALQSATGTAEGIFLKILSSVESILLALLFCRSGLHFLLSQPEATELIVLALQDPGCTNKIECITLRQAAALLSKCFFCCPQEVGMIVEHHVKVGSAVSRMISAPPNSEDLLWILWELCSIARSDSGRQALLALGYYPEAVSVLINSVSSYKDLDSVDNGGGSPLGLAIFHTAAEILEVLVTDSAASSVVSWICRALDLHKALHSFSPGSNRKDAPTRLLEWIDAGVVYQRNGATGLLRYSAVLASGGDIHLSSTSILVSDTLDAENIVANSNNSSDGQIIDNLLGKLVLDKYFDGLSMHHTSIVQLTTAFRILAFISEDSATASALFEEGVITVVYVVLVNCKTMLERLSNSYDYLVDEGAELSSTNDLLLDRSLEQILVDLMIPVLLLLINILRKLHGSKEQYRNKRLVNALLKLHREVSPKLAACSTDLSFMYPGVALCYGVVCHLITSALACWPLFGWLPGLFHCLLENIQATAASFALGPKDACSLIYILGDLFPDEGIWLWQSAIPPLSAIKSLCSGAVLGLRLEREVNWYLNPEHVAVLLVRLTPQLGRVALVVEKFATSELKVIQDMLQIFIVRIASQKVECAVVILRPIFSWLEKVVETTPSDMDSYKVCRILNFLACLSEHPNAKVLLIRMETVKILSKVLYKCSAIGYPDGISISGTKGSFSKFSLNRWKIPIFKFVAALFGAQGSMKTNNTNESLNFKAHSREICLLLCSVLKFCQILPVGHELLACFLAFKQLASSPICGDICSLVLSKLNCSHDQEYSWDNPDIQSWKQTPPLLTCWRRLVTSLDANSYVAPYVAETLYALTFGSVCLAKSTANSEGLLVLRCLFGLSYDLGDVSSSLKDVLDEILSKIGSFICDIEQGDGSFSSASCKSVLSKLKESLQTLSSLLQSNSIKFESTAPEEIFEVCSSTIRSIYMTSQLMPTKTTIALDDEPSLFFTNVWKHILDEEKIHYLNGEFEDRFVWELSTFSSDKQLSGHSRRKMAAEGSVRRTRDNQTPDAPGQNSRSLVMTNPPSAPSRRDNFRQRKPNTSRPPSLHVDEYVLRERNIDGTISGSYIASSTQRGPMSGRPPSIHVDEFIARERERQNPTISSTTDASQANDPSRPNEKSDSKAEKPRQLKSYLGDDQEINIVFDEESVSDDKLAFPQPDDSLHSPTAVIGENSPRPVIDDPDTTHSDTVGFQLSASPSEKEDDSLNIGSQRRLAVHDSLHKNFSSSGTRRSSRPGEVDESKYGSPRAASRAYNSQHPSSMEISSQSGRLPTHHLSSYGSHRKRSPPKFADSSLGSESQMPDFLYPKNQPPLPPVPPPMLSRSFKSSDSAPRNSSTHVTAPRDVPPVFNIQQLNGANVASGLQFQSDNVLPISNSTGSGLLSSDTKLWTPITGSKLPVEALFSNSPARAMHSLPSQYSTPMSHFPRMNSGPLAFNSANPTSPSLMNDSLGMATASGASLPSLTQPSFVSPSVLNRPPNYPGLIFNSALQQQLPSCLPDGTATAQHSISAMQSQPPLQPPLPQQPHPSQSAQLPTSNHAQQPQLGQSLPYPHSSAQVQIPLNFSHQIHVPQMPSYQQGSQESVSQTLYPMASQTQSQNQNLADSSSVQQNESQTSLQQFFSSPEAIQSLLSDRDKLCQLLEQHPKLMQMIQDRLGQI